jgi:hypothetical protein
MSRRLAALRLLFAVLCSPLAASSAPGAVGTPTLHTIAVFEVSVPRKAACSPAGAVRRHTSRDRSPVLPRGTRPYGLTSRRNHYSAVAQWLEQRTSTSSTKGTKP